MSETTIEDLGKWQWSLVVTDDGEVAARSSVPHDGVLTYSTRERANRADKNSEYQLAAREVVERYVHYSETGRDADDLLDAVQEALDDGDQEDTHEHLTELSTIDGGAVFHCQTCGAEGDAPDAVAHHPDCPDDETPTRHEPADFGGGESTGVQDL